MGRRGKMAAARDLRRPARDFLARVPAPGPGRAEGAAGKAAWWWVALFLLPCVGVAAAPSSTGMVEFFEKKIRPLLSEHCHECHSARAEKLKGGLALDSYEGLLKGGELGPALNPSHPEKSLLLKAVRYTDPDLQMPPKNHKLTDRQIADLERWVRDGAPWPAPDPAAVAAAVRSPAPGLTNGRDWWAFQPIGRPPVPPVKKAVSAGHPIDAFVIAALEAKGLAPNGPATRRELIRRAYFDLIGLPPSPEAIAAFEHDRSPGAYESLLDHLLALPQYGERWGRHWLDVVRYAQSNGYERDGEKPEAWRYRDYVVRAFNADKPYDQFVREQLAGDELERVTPDSIVATGFQRLGVYDDEPDDKRMAEFDELDDVLSTTGSAFLGLTIGCARCHDHKFDPIPQADYYQLLSFFRNLRLNESAKFSLDSPNYVALADPEKVRVWKAGHEAKLKPLQDQLATAKDEAARKKLSKQLEELKEEKPPFDWALAVRERGPKPLPTHVLIRGNAGSPGPEVQPAFLKVLGGQKPALPVPAPAAASTGRRRALAEWIANANNPLTARVMANRIWQHHFGWGIVKTPSDFGRAGALPTHPKLLDWLAAEWIASGWSIKKLHKTIMLSQTYQRSSRARNAKALAVDPGNDLLWRQNLRRLEAEALRDTILGISGRLNLKQGGRGFFPRLSGEVLAGQSRPGLDWEISSPEEQSRRSLYAYVRRTMSVPMLDAFDYSNTTSPLSDRPVTTVAPQSLLLLNDAFMQEQSKALLERLTREGGPAGPSSTAHFIQRGFQLAVGREPTRRELQLAVDFIRRQEKSFDALRSRLTFRPDVPNSLSVDYMAKLEPGHFLIGPAEGWSYQRGRWSGPYESIRTVDRERGPFALWTGATFSNGVIEARMVPHIACESAGLLVRASAKDHELHGYELALEPREQRVVLRRHTAGLVTLAEAPARVPAGQSLPVKIEAAGARLRVWLGEGSRPVIDCTDPQPILAAGRVGVRAWGAALSVDDLVLHPEGEPALAVGDGQRDPPERRARQAFCLLLLNLNEVVYVD